MSSFTLWLLILPLASFCFLGIAGRYLPRPLVAAIGCGVVLAAFVIAIGDTIWFTLHTGNTVVDVPQWEWISAGPLHITFGLLLDRLSTTMLLVVTGVGFLIHVYSIGYMQEENPAGFARFFAFMNFFVFAMTLLVLADSFLFLLVGWAGVGLASFLLIGFWWQRPAAVAAAKKAFVINVIGDFGLMLAIFLLVGKFNTLSFLDTIVQRNCTFGCPAFPLSQAFVNGGATTTAIALLLLLAAAAKSAQLPLHLWLPDAMEGPTPVSALIHAATMVTAGVYLVARCHVIFEASPVATTVLAVMGGASALYAATTALFQYDIKRVLAYSTMSQLGYMFMGESVDANSSAIFHLMTHAFFKALLFMAAGSVIHALGGEQDIRKMSGLWRSMPITFGAFVIGGLALAGFFPFAGFWSKDAILGAILTRAQTTGSTGDYLLWAVGIGTAVLTGLYIFRVIFTVFLGSPDANAYGAHGAPHEPVITMTVPMMVLAVLSTIGGLAGTPFKDSLGDYLTPALGTPSAQGTLSIFVASTDIAGISLIIGFVAAIIGIGLAWPFYGRHRASFQPRNNPIYLLFANAYYLDPLFNTLFVKPVVALGRGFNIALEGWVLTGSNSGIAWLVSRASMLLRRFQTGYVRNYALAIVAGAVLIVLYYLISSGHQ